MGRFFSALFVVMSFLFLNNASLQNRIGKKRFDDKLSIMNAAKPLKSTIKLEVEKTREIDPYLQPNVAMRGIRFSRDATGRVILYDPNRAEGHLYSADGTYLCPLIKRGQGPGEFSPQMGSSAYFLGSEIWVFGSSKAARFGEDGRLLFERKIAGSHLEPIEKDYCLTLDSMTADLDFDQVLSLVTFPFERTDKERVVPLFQKANIGAIRGPGGRSGFAEGWGTPHIVYSSDAALRRIYCGLSTDYRISVKDFLGTNLFVFQIPYQNIKVSRKDVEHILPFAAKDDRMTWMLDAFPTHLNAIKGLTAMPSGHVAVQRIIAPLVYAIDVFDSEGRYLYALIPPVGIDFDEARFFEKGFATIEMRDDYPVYREYRIKNLPEIFGMPIQRR